MKTDKELFIEFLNRCDIQYYEAQSYFNNINKQDAIYLQGRGESEYPVVATPWFYFDPETGKFIRYDCIE